MGEGSDGKDTKKLEVGMHVQNAKYSQSYPVV